MENLDIKKYETIDQDQINILHYLYNNSFDLVKMTKDNFVKRLYWNNIKKIYYLAEINNVVIGYLIIVNNSILLLIVDEKHKNKGIGSNLLQKAEEEIKKYYDKINLVAPDCFLCGVPMDSKSNYHKWFEKKGFVYDWTPFDMTVDLEKYLYKEEDIWCNLDGTEFKWLERNSDELLSCYNSVNETENGWGEYYIKDNIEAIIAIKDKEVIGGVIVPSYCIFDESLKETGSFGVIWVHKKFRDKGIGMKLYHKSLYELKKRGYKICHIGYTYLDAFYSTLGGKKYINYWIGEKKIIE